MNTKLHAICDSKGRPLDFFVTAGQVSDYIGARVLIGSLPKVDWLLGDRGYDADWFREALKDKGIRACIPGRKQRKARSATTSAATNGATGSKSCSAGSRIGGAWQPDTTDAQRSSSQQSPSPHSSFIGYES